MDRGGTSSSEDMLVDSRSDEWHLAPMPTSRRAARATVLAIPDLHDELLFETPHEIADRLAK